MAARIQELSVAFGFHKQTDIVTANVLADIWRLNKIDASILNPKPVTEDDAAEIGKGHEFATATYKSHFEVGPYSISKFLSAEILAWATSFGLGATVKSGAGPYTYTATPMDPVTAGLELPYFSYLEAIRQGAGVITDKMFVGSALESFLVSIASGPGRASSKIALEILCSGKITDPSGISHPAKTAEKELPAYSLALTVNGVNYVSNKNIVSCEWGWKNNIMRDTGFFPGSGQQDGYQVMGRMEVGVRTPIFRFVARFVNGSSEYTTLKALTTGTAVITQTFDADNTYTATFQQLGYKVVDLGETNGLVTVGVEGSPQYKTSVGVLSVATKCGVDGICQAPTA